MKVQRDKLQQYQKRIKIVTDRETEVARECLRKGHKDKALLALRRKKYQESLLTKTDQQLAQLQALTSDVEFALVQKDIVFGLQQGTAVLKEIHKEMGGLDKVELIMSETEEAQAYQNVSEADKRCANECAWLTNMARKSTKCWAVKCQMRMRTRWKMSFWPWKGKRMARLLCPMRPHRFKSLCQRFLQTTHSEQERRKGHNGAREKPLPRRRRGILDKACERNLTDTHSQYTDIYKEHCHVVHDTVRGQGLVRCNMLPITTSLTLVFVPRSWTLSYANTN
jgi:hypothetical protein